MEDIILVVLTALAGTIVGFLGGFIAKGRAFVASTETKLDDKILAIVEDAIAKSKE